MGRFYYPEQAKGYQLCYQAFVLEPHFPSLPKELLQTLRRKKQIEHRRNPKRNLTSTNTSNPTKNKRSKKNGGNLKIQQPRPYAASGAQVVKYKRLGV